MKVFLERFAYLADRTMGVLYCGEEILYTVERPWIRSLESLGGAPFESCIPDGAYSLAPFSSASHPDCYSVVNPALDVHLTQHQTGRYAILLHPGNSVKDVVGCIAPGLSTDGVSVWHSRAAMDKIRAVLGDESHVLEIRPKGATN